MKEKVALEPYVRHIVFCIGGRCADAGVGEKLYEYLKQRLKDLALNRGEKRIHRSKTTCLGVCQGGPVAVVYPEGIWYGDLDEKKTEQIIQEHLLCNRPVEKLIFHKMNRPEAP